MVVVLDLTVKTITSSKTSESNKSCNGDKKNTSIINNSNIAMPLHTVVCGLHKLSSCISLAHTVMVVVVMMPVFMVMMVGVEVSMALTLMAVMPNGGGYDYDCNHDSGSGGHCGGGSILWLRWWWCTSLWWA